MLLLRTLLLLLLTIFLDLKSIESRLADEFYCKVDENVFRVCRGCPTVDENCEDFTKCQCGKIELYSNKAKDYAGGADCQSHDNGGNWCFVTTESSCQDMEYTGGAVASIWIPRGFPMKSYAACKNTSKPPNVGNEWFKQKLRIIGDDLVEREGGGGFTSPTPEACQTECYIRSGVCGAWTFESYPNSEDGSGSCRLKSINACCGQFAKREVTATASVVSGYMCSKCWSTRNQCPCSFEDRRSSIDSNFIIAGGALKDLSPTSIFAATRRPCSYKRVVFRWSKRWRRWRRVNVQKDDNPESVSC